MKTSAMAYRGRLAPTPSGDLHIGHALTFLAAYERAKAANGALILRIEDLYADHCRMDFVWSIIEDLRWLGIRWQEGPDVGGPCGPYVQSERNPYYREIWKRLYDAGAIYPSAHTRKDVERALSAPHEGDSDPVFPVELRPESFEKADSPGEVNWRFRANYGEVVSFVDNRAGPRSFVAGKDFGDFVVWCKNGWPSYELAVVADDRAMNVTEVVRGEDLLLSTARQILLYRALGWAVPQFYHCPLVRDENGVRLAKRSDSVSIRELRRRGMSPEEIFAMARVRKTL
jgi:glutamyl/glutaminyl-tRNA synthetase